MNPTQKRTIQLSTSCGDIDFCFKISLITQIIILSWAMGNKEFSLSENVRSQWGEKFLEGRRTFFNKITLEQFQLFVLSILRNRTNVHQLVHRSIYLLPNTPKVIILNDNRGELSILAQRPFCALSVVLGQLGTELQLLQMLHKTVVALRGLFLRYGPFQLADSMLAANQRGEPMVWINSRFERNYIQKPLSHTCLTEQTMVKKTIYLLESMVRGELVSHKIFRQSVENFKSFQDMLEEAFTNERDGISSKKMKGKSIKVIPFRTFSLRNKFQSADPLAKQINDKINKRNSNNVPKFIKSLKNRNNVLPNRLTSLEGRINGVKSIKKCGDIGHNYLNFAKFRSLQGSPESNKMASTLQSTANSFNQSQARLGLSKHQYKTVHILPINQLEIPLIHSLRSIEFLDIPLIPEVNEEQNTYRQVALNVPVPFQGILSTFCKRMSQSQQLCDITGNMKEQEQNISLQVNAQGNESVVIHSVQGSGTFYGQYSALQQQMGRIFF